MGAAKRKWVRRERRYSNAMWHAGWHEMKYGRFAGFKLAACLDDASRCATGAALFKEASGESAAGVLRGAAARFGAPAAAASGSRTPGALEALSHMGTSTAKPGGGRAYGKLARFYGAVEAEIRRYEGLSAERVEAPLFALRRRGPGPVAGGREERPAAGREGRARLGAGSARAKIAPGAALSAAARPGLPAIAQTRLCLTPADPDARPVPARPRLRIEADRAGRVRGPRQGAARRPRPRGSAPATFKYEPGVPEP